MGVDNLRPIAWFTGSIRSVGLTGQLLRGGVGSLAVKIAVTGIGIVNTVVLARVLGPGEFGDYSFVLALVLVLAIPAQFGVPTLVLRETAKAHSLENWGRLRGLWRWAFTATSVISLGVTALAAATVLLLGDRLAPALAATLLVGLALVPLQALTGLGAYALQGLRRVVLGQLPESVVRPGLLLGGLVLSILVGGTGFLTSTSVMGVHVGAACVAGVLTVVMLRRHRPREVLGDVRPVYDRRRWIRSVVPLAVVSGMALINTQADLLMIGVLRSRDEVGVYRVASQGAMLVSFGLSAFAMAVMPHFARFHAVGDVNRLQRLATIGARAMLAFAVPAALFLVFFGEWILSKVFGAPYAVAYVPLAVLSVAHVFHAGFGVLGPLLNMTGHEADTAKGITIAALSNVLLNATLIPRFGTTGAAVATAITLLIWNGVLWFAVRRTLGVDSSALGMTYRPPAFPSVRR